MVGGGALWKLCTYIVAHSSCSDVHTPFNGEIDSSVKRKCKSGVRGDRLERSLESTLAISQLNDVYGSQK